MVFRSRSWCTGHIGIRRSCGIGGPISPKRGVRRTLLVVQRSSLTFSHMLGNHCFRFSLKPAQFPDGMHNHKQIHYVSCTRPLEYDELLLLMIDTGFRRNPDSRWSVSLAGLR